MLDMSIISFYNNIGLIFKGSEDMATKIINNWPLSSTLVITDASS